MGSGLVAVAAGSSEAPRAVGPVSTIFAVAKVSAVVAVLTIMWNLLPDAPESLDALTIPDEVWDPLVGVLQLDRYFPISTLLAIAAVAVSIKVGMLGMWLYAWVAKHVFGGG